MARYNYANLSFIAFIIFIGYVTKIYEGFHTITVQFQMLSPAMAGGKKSLFMFLMRLAWRCRYSMPLLLSGTAALLGHAWMFQIRVTTVYRLRENELAYYEEDEADLDDEVWETESDASWETIVEEVAHG